MGSAEDYNKELARIEELTARQAESAADLSAKESVESLRKQALDVGIRFGEFYRLLMDSPAELKAEIARRSKAR